MAQPRNILPNLLVLIAAVTISMSAGTTFADDAVRGVTDTEIIIGTMTDLSGVRLKVQAVNNGQRNVRMRGVRTVKRTPYGARVHRPPDQIHRR